MNPNPYAPPREQVSPSISRAAGPQDLAGYRSPRGLGQMTLVMCGLVLASNWLFTIVSLVSSTSAAFLFGRIVALPSLAAMIVFRIGSAAISISFAMLVLVVRRISDGQDALYAAAVSTSSS